MLVRNTANVDAIAIDDGAGIVWAVGPNRFLRGFTFDGRLEHRARLPCDLGATASNITIEIDVSTGDVWIAAQKRLGRGVMGGDSCVMADEILKHAGRRGAGLACLRDELLPEFSGERGGRANRPEDFCGIGCWLLSAGVENELKRDPGLLEKLDSCADRATVASERPHEQRRDQRIEFLIFAPARLRPLPPDGSA